MRNSIILFIVCTLCSCAPVSEPLDRDVLEQEVIETERAFAAMADSAGVPVAFAHFAAEDVVMLRGKRLIRGREELRDYFVNQTLQDVKLSWEPAFVDVSSCGDMAYTYGPYTFSAKDTSGVQISDTGFFHTVWKRQPDGEWKFVWD